MTTDNVVGLRDGRSLTYAQYGPAHLYYRDIFDRLSRR